MADDDLLGLYWTVSGPVEVHVGREWSLFDFADRCAQARRVGYAGVGIWHADLEHLLETRKLRELAQIVADNGLRYLELEFIMDWFLDPGDERRVESDRVRRLLFEAAAALPVHHIKVGNIPGTPAPIAQVTERFGELCADAAEHHDAAIVYEFMPFDVNVNTLEAAVAVVEGAGVPNGGIAFDTWHMGKLGIAPEDLRAVPAERLTWIELSDGRRENMPDLIDETVNHRLLPGEGEFEPARYVEVARELGYSGPWGVEVLSEDLRNLPIEEIFQRSYDTSMSQLRAGVA
jgi:sugar phosphate isomerase/epimerase